MDRRSLRSGSCNGGGKNPAPPSPAAGSKEDTGGGGERKALLPRRPPGGLARKGQRGSKPRVQWKDSHGKKLVEVLEFQPRIANETILERGKNGERIADELKLEPTAFSNASSASQFARAMMMGAALHVDPVNLVGIDSSDSDDEYLDTCICSIM